MRRKIILLFLILLVVLAELGAADLATAPAEELLGIYSQIRQFRPGDQGAVTENVVWKRDAATFTFHEGRMVFAAPVAGRILAATFQGRGTFLLEPPTPADQRQIARYAKSPKLEDQFREAVFFFTDDSWSELQKLLKLQSGGTPQAGEAISSAQKKLAENFNDWWANESKRHFSMRNLAARMLADLTDPTSRGFFLADFKGERSGDLLFHISWNRDSLLLMGISNDEEVMLLHYNLGDYYEWWSGFHLREEYARTPRPEHRKLLAHCRRERLEAEVGKDRELAATAEMEFEVPGGPARLLPLNLRGVLRISSVQNGEGKNLAFIQEPRNLDNDPWVILPEPAKPDQAYKMRIAYSEDSTRDSRIIYQQGPGLFYVTSRTSWFPSFGAFDDRTHYSMRIRSPKKFQFVGTGRRVKSEKTEDYLETEWESEIPYSVVGFNYGDFVEKEQSDSALKVTAYAGKEVPDELRSLGPAFTTDEFGRARAQVVGDDKYGGLNPAGRVGHAAAISYQALKVFEHYFGVLPFKTISVTAQPVRGYGQSWPTLIFLPYDSLLDATTRTRFYMQESAEAREFYSLVAVHEMAHQWWGHVVGWKTYHDQWLSEGLAQYSTVIYLRKFQPQKLKSFWDLKRKWLLSKNPRGNRPVDVGPLWLGAQLSSYLEPRVAFELTYYKGAYVMEMLRLLIWDARQSDPDARFIAMMRDFVATYAGRNASTEDFRRVVEKHMGQPMGWFFEQWVYGAETPHYDFTYQLKTDAAGKPVAQISLTQSRVSDSFFSYVPVYVYVKNSARLVAFLKVTGSRTVTAEVPLSVKADKLGIDDGHSLLCTTSE